MAEGRDDMSFFADPFDPLNRSCAPVTFSTPQRGKARRMSAIGPQKRSVSGEPIHRCGVSSVVQGDGLGVGASILPDKDKTESVRPPQPMLDSRQVVMETPEARAGDKRSCPLCHQSFAFSLRRHALQSHLPWFADPTRVCWVCYSTFRQGSHARRHFEEECLQGLFSSNTTLWVPLLNRMFNIICRALHLPSLEALVNYVAANRDLQPPTAITTSAEDAQVMRLMDLANNEPACRREYKFTPPNSVPSLLQWRILSTLLARIDQQSREEVFALRVSDVAAWSAVRGEAGDAAVVSPVMSDPVTRSSEVSLAAPVARLFVGSPAAAGVTPQLGMDGVSKGPEPSLHHHGGRLSCHVGVDAHFHLDHLMEKSRHKSIEEAINYVPKDVPFRLERAFPSYAFPERWPDLQKLQLPEQVNRVAWGWHPTRSSMFLEDTQFRATFRDMMQSPFVCAVGEVGLDYFHDDSSNTKQNQLILLEFACQEARLHGLPLVLHCRDREGRNSAVMDTLRVLRENLTPDWKVYLHCYNYGLFEFCRWLQVFPHCVLGVAPKGLQERDRHPSLIEVIQCAESDRLLLETDSPYFRMGRGYPHGSPSQVYSVAKTVAEWKGIPTGDVLRDAARATHGFYGV